MSNETTITPNVIQILQSKIESFNKQRPEYNQDWINISKISIDKLIKLTFSEEKIEYGENATKVTIVERKDGKLCYYLFNLPNNCGIYIRKEDLICYVAEGEKQDFSSNKFVYHNDNNFIEAENQEISDDYLTIDWNETDGKWIATYVYNQYGVMLTFSGETIKYNNEKIIVERKNDNKLYYYLYNLPYHFGIHINEEGAVCYSKEVAEGQQLEEDKRFSADDLIYYDGNSFIIIRDQVASDIKILEAKINAFNKQWQEYNQNWTNISNIKESKYNKYGVTLNISENTITCGDEETIIKQKGQDNKFYYHLYNLPNHFGIRINEQDAICYSEKGKEKDKRFSVGDLVYRDGSNFIITKDPTTSGYYFTIDPINKRLVATYKTAFFKEAGSTFDFNFMQRLDSPYTYFQPISNGYRDYVIRDVNKNISSYCGENYGMEAPFHLYTMKKINNTYEEIYDDQIWYFRSEIINGALKNNLVILHEKPVSAKSFYQLVR